MPSVARLAENRLIHPVTCWFVVWL